jgi:radical SAM/Cys-rich protein
LTVLGTLCAVPGKRKVWSIGGRPTREHVVSQVSVANPKRKEQIMQPALLPFAERVRQAGIRLTQTGIDTVQINVGKRCNQACVHCHVDASPKRTEIMDQRTVELALELIRAARAQTVDVTGGAPELNPSFRFVVEQARHDGRHVIDRCNLAVLFEPGQEDLPEFLASMWVEVVASLPCYLAENVQKQRDRGVYDKSIKVLRLCE